ncbi:MAG: hypothetical protein KDB27_25045 [Planctomycetales bacterium]|nr:hypothetical protein [Planctomycetales bacterium]
MFSRRRFLQRTTQGAISAALLGSGGKLFAQQAGDRPEQSPGVKVLNPKTRVPVGLIIDDSTCLVNLNRFAMPQFNTAWNSQKEVYHRNWKQWPVEIPDSFVRKFGEWCAEHGVKGKYSIVPFPACVGRLDRELPGWSRRELSDSINLVRDLMMPNWDIHPEMVTHTRVINLKTGHPFPDYSPKFMENWDWTTGKSVDQLTAYHAYGLQILKNVGLPCEGLTTPGGYGSGALPQLSQATLESVRDVFGAEVPHYFRHLYTDDRSVAPRVEYASDLNTDDPKCVVSVIGCTGDWTGGWDNVEPAGVDKFITPDLQTGRMVDVITNAEPAMMVCHWTGIHWNGEEKGFKVFQEVVRRLHARFDNLIWMKLSELSRYWAAKELTQIDQGADSIRFRAPFACPDYTVSIPKRETRQPSIQHAAGTARKLTKVAGPLALTTDSWCEHGNAITACFDLSKGVSELTLI